MSKKLTWIGVAITAAYLMAAALLGWGRWDQFSGMKPNEVGDFLAGVVGPLALLWLILGYFQQGEELRNSAAALRLQAEELKASVQQQTELVSVTREQLAADRAALDAQYTPKLRLEVRSVGCGYYHADVFFDLQNHGDVARDVHIEIGAFPLEFDPTYFPSIPAGEKVQASLKKISKSHCGPYRFPIRYKDRLGRLQTHEIDLSLEASGTEDSWLNVVLREQV